MKQTRKHSIGRIFVFGWTVVILFATGCHNHSSAGKRDPNSYYATIEKKGADSLIVCQATKIKHTVVLPLSQMIDSCQIILPETRDSSLLPRVSKFALSRNYICLAGYGHPAKLFTRQGKYVCTIGGIGHGPAEYPTSVSQLIMNEKDNSIYLIPANRIDKIYHYDLKGKFVEAIPLLHMSPKARFWIQNDTITVVTMSFDAKTPIVYQQTRGGKLLNQSAVRKDMLVEKYNGEVFSSRQSDYDFYLTDRDTLYRYDPAKSQMVPTLVSLPFPNRKWQILREFPAFYFGVGTYTNGQNKIKKFNLLVEKKTLKTFSYKLVNDFYGSIPGGALFMSYGHTYVNSMPAITVIDEMKKALKKNQLGEQQKQKLQGILSRLHENDNDVVFVGHLKDNIDL